MPEIRQSPFGYQLLRRGKPLFRTEQNRTEQNRTILSRMVSAWRTQRTMKH